MQRMEDILAITWPTFLSPWWGLLGLLAVPVVLLYVLRQKRPDLPVSSTLLWAKVLADMRASTPWQRLRRNLLLLLQLIILAALVLTRMQPVIQARATSSVAGVIVIDATASMQATDVGGHGGKTRIEEAKIQAHKLIDDMKPGDRYMLLVDGGGLVQLRSAFTGSKTELHGLIDQVRASDTSTDLSETLLLAVTSLKAIGSPNANKNEALTAGRIWLFSDGAGVKLPNVPELQRLLQFVKIGESSDNVGVVRLAVTAVPKKPDTYEVFAGLINTAKQPRTVTVGLAYGAPDRFLRDQVKEVTLPASSQGGVVFDNVVAKPGRIYVQVAGRDPDDFPLDNTAYALVEAPRAVRTTLVTKGNELLEGFLKTAAAVGKVDKTASHIVAPESYSPSLPADLVIFDGVAPAAMPKCDAVLIRPPGSTADFKVIGELKNPPVLRWKRDDPVLAYVELGDLRISSALRLERDPEARELVSAPDAPLIVAKDVGSARRYLVSFSPTMESNWWSHPSLLVFLQNVITQTRSRHFIGTPQILAAGQAAQLWDLGEKASVKLPSGQTVDVATRDGAAEFAGTDHVGFYDVTAADKSAAFAVNLLNETESNIEPRSLETRAGGIVEETANVAQVNREIWTWVALAALAVLLAEWFVYHRRMA